MTLEETKAFFEKDVFATETTGIEIIAVDKDYSKVKLVVSEKHLAAHGGVMGGAIYTMADFAFAVATNTPDELTMTTSSSIQYVGQAKDKTLYAECCVVKNGRRSCTFETRITDGIGTLIAIALSGGMHL